MYTCEDPDDSTTLVTDWLFDVAPATNRTVVASSRIHDARRVKGFGRSGDVSGVSVIVMRFVWFMRRTFVGKLGAAQLTFIGVGAVIFVTAIVARSVEASKSFDPSDLPTSAASTSDCAANDASAPPDRCEATESPTVSPMPSAQPTPSPSGTITAGPYVSLPTVATLTVHQTDAAGYSQKVTVSTHPVQRLANLSDPFYIGVTSLVPADFGCFADFDVKLDAFVPVSVYTENTTPGYETQPSYRVSIAKAQNYPSMFLRHAKSIESITLLQVYSGGKETCGKVYDAASLLWNQTSITTTWEQPAPAGELFSGTAYIIIHGYFSPKTPEGNVGVLDNLLLAAGPTSDFPTLDRVEGNAGHMWPLNDACQAPFISLSGGTPEMIERYGSDRGNTVPLKSWAEVGCAQKVPSS